MNDATEPGARLFLALWPDDDGVRQALARCRDAWRWPPGASPEPDARLHLTLHFIGAVPVERVPALVDGLRVPVEPFTLQLDAMARWPNGVAVLTPSQPPAGLLALHAALRGALERLSLRTEPRPYRPHVTLARRAGDAVAPDGVPPLAWPVGGYVLACSSPAAGRAYRVLQRCA